MDAKLSVEVGAKINELQTKMVQGEKSVSNFVDKSNKNLNKFALSGGQSFQNFSNGAKNASFTLINFNRVLQDAPFGILGIANNIDPLVQSFIQLKQETGSTGGALKALATTMTGPTGVLFAFTLISTGLLLYNQYLQKTTKETKDLDKATQDLAEGAGKEIAKLTVLYDASQDLNRPLAERKRLVDELQKQYPTTFGNLKDEAILAGKAETAYNSLTQSLINAAIVRGGEDTIAGKVKQLAAALIAFQEESRKYSQATKGKGFLAKNSSFNVDENGDLETLSDYETRLKKEISDTRKSIQDAIGGFSAADIIGDFGSKGDKAKKSVKTVSDVLKELRIDLNQINNDIGIDSQGEKITKKFDAYRKAISELTSLGTIPANAAIKDLKKTAEGFNLPLDEKIAGKSGLLQQTSNELVTLGDKVENITVKVPKMADAFLDAQNEILSSGFIETFASIGEAMGQSLASGENLIEGFAQAALSSIGDVLIRFGKLTIAAGVASTALGKALKNPLLPGAGIGAIAAGVALIAVGAAVRGFGSGIGNSNTSSSGNAKPKRIPGFATGVENFRGGWAVVGEKGPELVNLPSGSDVIPNHAMPSMGRAEPQIFIADTVLRGRDIRISYNRETALAHRNGA